MSRRPLVVVGDALLDRDLDGYVQRLAPDAPVPVVEEPIDQVRPGGAGLAAVLAAADGRDVVLLTALADDDAGRTLAGLLRRAGVTVVDLRLEGATPEKVRVRAEGRSLLRVDRGGRGGRPGPLGRAGRDALAGAGAVLVADYGRGMAAAQDVRAALAARGPAPLVWDPHPRGAAPVPGALLATPNEAEAAHYAPDVRGDGLAATAEQARVLARRWQAAGVAVTLGDQGALLVNGGGSPLVVPTIPARGDPCGAGDRFSSTAAALLADGALPSEAVTAAVAAASEFVANGPAWRQPATADDAPGTGGDAEAVAAAVRARNGTVVATGGCFDLLHPGHLATLRGGRQLGDCLIVCLNSDASVRRLKGPDRPVLPEDQRAALLAALDCVDAVVVFDEDTPAAVLDRLRPDVFVKGGDYTVQDLPEADLLASWGGQAVILPYVAGHSTTGLISKASSKHKASGKGSKTASSKKEVVGRDHSRR